MLGVVSDSAAGAGSPGGAEDGRGLGEVGSAEGVGVAGELAGWGAPSAEEALRYPSSSADPATGNVENN
jgi:hypothetical protein